MMTKRLWRVRAQLGYWLARRLFHQAWALRTPKLWNWMQGQYARMANLGDQQAQSFYGHVLLFRGQGLGARDEGVRLLTLAAHAGDAKAAYQLGVLALQGDMRRSADAVQALKWWLLAYTAEHPLAAQRLHRLYLDGGPGLDANPAEAARYAAAD